MQSGYVDLLPPLNGPVTPHSRYMTRDGGEAWIIGPTKRSTDDVPVFWSVQGAWYDALTGEVFRESRFHTLAKYLGPLDT